VWILDSDWSKGQAAGGQVVGVVNMTSKKNLCIRQTVITNSWLQQRQQQAYTVRLAVCPAAEHSERDATTVVNDDDHDDDADDDDDDDDELEDEVFDTCESWLLDVAKANEPELRRT